MAIQKAIKIGHVAAAVVCIWGALNWGLRPSIWLVVDDVTIADAEKGSFVEMAVTRKIRRPFVGEYRVEVRSFTGRTIFCEAHGKVDYDPASEFPEPLTLDWWGWGDQRCHDLPDGRYRVLTTWEVERLGGFIQDGVVRSVSNYFTVGEFEQ